MQVKQSVVSGNGEQKASKNSKVENVSAQKTVALNALGGTPKSAQLQDMSAYLKIVSRLENLNARQDSLPEPAIQGFIQGLVKQVSQMNDHEKALLLRIPEVKSLNIKNAEELIDKIENKLTEEQVSEKLFELLRQPKFVELIDPSQKMQTYGSKTLNPIAASVGVAAGSETRQFSTADNIDTTDALPTQSQFLGESLPTNSKPQSV